MEQPERSLKLLTGNDRRVQIEENKRGSLSCSPPQSKSWIGTLKRRWVRRGPHYPGASKYEPDRCPCSLLIECSREVRDTSKRNPKPRHNFRKGYYFLALTLFIYLSSPHHLQLHYSHTLPQLNFSSFSPADLHLPTASWKRRTERSRGSRVSFSTRSNSSNRSVRWWKNSERPLRRRAKQSQRRQLRDRRTSITAFPHLNHGQVREQRRCINHRRRLSCQAIPLILLPLVFKRTTRTCRLYQTSVLCL